MSWIRLGRVWDPLEELRRVQRAMNRAFENANTGEPREFPPMNVYAGTDSYVVQSALPGLKAESLDLTVTGDTLTIKGAREADQLGEKETYHRQERGFGPFVRSIKLPSHVDANKVEAKYAKGILRVTLPRAEETKPRKITLRSGN